MLNFLITQICKTKSFDLRHLKYKKKHVFIRYNRKHITTLNTYVHMGCLGPLLVRWGGIIFVSVFKYTQYSHPYIIYKITKFLYITVQYKLFWIFSKSHPQYINISPTWCYILNDYLHSS